jgi:tRNA dimethylallyltransferase
MNAAILTLDAMQVYRGADIGTSKPTAAERGEIPHGGLDLVEFGATFDVARYLEHAARFLREQREAGRRVIVVGGTGLYFRALTRGFCGAPQGSLELRCELNQLGVRELRERLARVDPLMLPRLDASNPRRLARAIEVMEASGRSLAEWQAATPAALVGTYEAFWLQREKEDLQDRMARRLEAMLTGGWVEEVRELIVRAGAEAVRDFPAIGYQEIGEMLAGRASTASVRREILLATRQYAKRQLTWFNREPNLKKVMLSGLQSLPTALVNLL